VGRKARRCIISHEVIPEHSPWTCEEFSAFGSRRLGKLIVGRRWECMHASARECKGVGLLEISPVLLGRPSHGDLLRQKKNKRLRDTGDGEALSTWANRMVLETRAGCQRPSHRPADSLWSTARATATRWHQVALARQPRWATACLSGSSSRLMLRGLHRTMSIPRQVSPQSWRMGRWARAGSNLHPSSTSTLADSVDAAGPHLVRRP